jgi:hypothetical protein
MDTDRDRARDGDMDMDTDRDRDGERDMDQGYRKGQRHFRQVSDPGEQLLNFNISANLKSNSKKI